MEQLVILLVIGLISLVNWLIQKSAEAREKRKLERQADRGETARAEVEDESFGPDPRHQDDPDESMRRLMEALGLPTEAPPPKPVERRVAPAPVNYPEEVAPPPLPPRRFFPEAEMEPPAPVYRRAELPPPVPERIVIPSTSAPKTRLKPTRPIPEVAVTTSASASRVRRMLAQPDSLRDAVVLSEILGAPKALR